MAKYIKALVLSDTHGNKAAINQVLQKCGAVDYIFHLGDNASDIRAIDTTARVVCVKGNCDMGCDIPETEEVVIKGHKIILTHGHRLHVKYSYDRVNYYAHEHEARILLFGHTHMPYLEYAEGIWLLNPGSTGESDEICYATFLVGDVGVIPKLESVY
ncbi:MAG: YfcE family phosphodiesterase [Christensenellaceae bacterium]